MGDRDGRNLPVLARQGWIPKTLTPGMKVKTIIHPLRDATTADNSWAITLPDGTLMGIRTPRRAPMPELALPISEPELADLSAR